MTIVEGYALVGGVQLMWYCEVCFGEGPEIKNEY